MSIFDLFGIVSSGISAAHVSNQPGMPQAYTAALQTQVGILPRTIGNKTWQPQDAVIFMHLSSGGTIVVTTPYSTIFQL